MLRHLLVTCALGALLWSATEVSAKDPAGKTHWDYIVVGAGPAGLQLGYYLEQAGRDYVVMERAKIAGNFFDKYPRHNRLISINKRNTGHVNKEFNMRHDWNSLLSHDDSLQIRHYSKEIFPDRRVLVKYLNDYTEAMNINVRYDTSVSNITALGDVTDKRFRMQDQNGNVFTCKALIMATGIFVPNTPTFQGHEFTESYEDISINPEDYEGQSVLIIGRGNTAFEVADSIFENTNVVHVMSRSRLRLSWETHYVGDLRAINNGLLDTYQLKSLDGVLEVPLDFLTFSKDNETGKINVNLKEGMMPFDNWPLRHSYDRVIRCMGWKFDDSVFSSDMTIRHPEGRARKYPLIGNDYQSVDYPGLYFAGTNTHSLDFRRSAGGFIHGFRYTTRALYHILEQKYEGVTWPSKREHISQAIPHVLKRLNEGSGIYQMFSVLGEVVVFNDDDTFSYFEAFPLKMLHKLKEMSGLPNVDRVLAVAFEYGKDFSGAGNDIFKSDRASIDPTSAQRSNFLHPVFYYYDQLPTEADMMNLGEKEALPRPKRLHHILEDFLTDFGAPTVHLLPLRRFLENCLQKDMRHAFAEDCARVLMTHGSAPAACQRYTEGQGLLADQVAWPFLHDKGMDFSLL